MRTRIPLLVASAALVLALALAPQAHALPDYPVSYTVYYSCHIGPGGCNPNGDWYGCLVGEWAMACTGKMHGWGMQPYTNCAMFVDEYVYFSEPCNPGLYEYGQTPTDSSN
jgi:hypothetical protein